MTEHTRVSDTPLIKINREVPLWSILTALGLMFLQGTGLYYGQAHLTEQINAQAVLIKDLSDKVNQVSLDITKTNLKTVEYDFRLNDIDRRLHQVETSQPVTLRRTP